MFRLSLKTWNDFWFRPMNPIALHGVRVLFGVLLLTWLLSFAGRQDAFFGANGWYDLQAYQETARLAEGPPSVGWSPIFVFGANWAIHLFYGFSLVAVALFTLGVWTRITGIIAWLAVVAFTTSPAMQFGGDALLHVLAFYLMIGYLLFGQSREGQSLRDRLLGSPAGNIRSLVRQNNERGSIAANIVIRLLQIHLAIAIFSTGMHKLQMSVWWSGLALWFPLHIPKDGTFAEIIASKQKINPFFYLSILNLFAYGLMAWQLAFPFYAWKKTGLRLVLAGSLLGWVGAWFVYHQPVFGPAIAIGCLAFQPAANWDWAIARLAGLVGQLTARRSHVSQSAPIATAQSVA